VDADVIVIGAGAAGLAAARSLAGRVTRVMLLEARDRVGGRVWSYPAAPHETPAELGAEFIHGPAEQTMRLLRETGMAAADTAGAGWTRGEDGELRSEDDRFSSTADMFEGARALAEDESVDQFLSRFDGDAATRGRARVARAFVEGFDAADPAIASVRSIANEWLSGVDFASARPLGGYAPMFERMRSDCIAAGVRIYLSTIVRRIAWQRGRVAIDVVSAGEARTIRARTAVVTLPVGVLRHRGDDTAVAFDPPLPARKGEALRRIEMGHVVKLVLWFRTAFWERLRNERYRNAAFFRFDGQPFPTYWTQLPVRSRLVVAWVGGPKAAALGGAAEAYLVDRAVHGFGALFNEVELAREEFEGGVMHDWSRDPFARGAYSYLAVAAGDARAALAAPVDDTILFAGEAMSSDDQGGTVNGALETGQRAAAEALAALGARSRPPHG
jgi:monoamine oxidase